MMTRWSFKLHRRQSVEPRRYRDHESSQKQQPQQVVPRVRHVRRFDAMIDGFAYHVSEAGLSDVRSMLGPISGFSLSVRKPDIS
jgi:hypothetical protein